MSPVKRYVKVIAVHEADGTIVPVRIYFDGKAYRVSSLKHTASMRELYRGGRGTRYTINVNGQETYLYEDRERFYVEAKEKGGDRDGIHVKQ